MFEFVVFRIVVYLHRIIITKYKIGMGDVKLEFLFRNVVGLYISLVSETGDKWLSASSEYEMGEVKLPALIAQLVD